MLSCGISHVLKLVLLYATDHVGLRNHMMGSQLQAELLMLLLAVCSERRVVESPAFSAFWETMNSGGRASGQGGGSGAGADGGSGGGGGGGAVNVENTSDDWANLESAAVERACAWALERVDHTLVFVIGSPTWYVLPYFLLQF